MTTAGLSPRIAALRVLLGFLILVAVQAVADDSQSGQIRGRVSIPQKFAPELPPGMGISAAKVILDGGAVSTLPTSDGYFVINNVNPGPHLLQVVPPRLIFDPVRIEAEDAKGTIKMSAYMADMEHGRGAKLKYPLGLAPSGMFQYLEKREEFNIMTVFKSPMALIMLFSTGMMFLMPKLQPMLEEEKRQRLEGDKQPGEDAKAVKN
mmetsp:Transcript_81277/g.211849  ORF Transcript_81277/g.211849 Transcript_81277/m.211849 type:complete len:207 (-) Transcript_81277:187-807(-)